MIAMGTTCRRARRNEQRLILAVIVGILATGQTACDDDSSPTATGGSPYATIERQVHALVNEHRRDQGLAALQWRDVIATQCRTHSVNMAEGITAFGHTGFNERGEAIDSAIPHSASAENVARVSGSAADPAASAVAIWLESDGHRRNIEGNYDMTGVGVARAADGRYYFTQFFLRAD